MKSAHTLAQALSVAQREHAHPTRDWAAYCQMFVRTCWGIPPLFGSAWAQWNGADAEDKHVGGHPSDAPVGSALLFKGSGRFGHIMFAAYPFPNETPAAWSNDLVRRGRIDKVARTAPTSAWRQTYLGYLRAVNDFDLQLAKPKQTKRYKAIENAIANLELSVETARHQHDAADVKALRHEINDLRALYARLRRY